MAESYDYGGARPRRTNQGATGNGQDSHIIPGSSTRSQMPERSTQPAPAAGVPADPLNAFRFYQQTTPKRAPLPAGSKASPVPPANLRQKQAQLSRDPKCTPSPTPSRAGQKAFIPLRDILPREQPRSRTEPHTHYRETEMPTYVRRSGVDRASRDRQTKAFDIDELSTLTHAMSLDPAHQSGFYDQPPVERRSRARSRTPSPDHSTISLVTKIRPCDFCHKEYLAKAPGPLSIEEWQPGSGPRVCDGCNYKHPTELKGKLVQLSEGWFKRFPTPPSPKDLESSHAEKFYERGLQRIPPVFPSDDFLPGPPTPEAQEFEMRTRERMNAPYSSVYDTNQYDYEDLGEV